MKRKATWAGLAALLLSCADAETEPLAPDEEEVLPESEIDDLVLDHRAPSKLVLHSLFGKATRDEITDDVAHYQFTVRLGRGEFDQVRIHRVVRERKRHRPVKTDGAVFMSHGASQDFEDIFLYAGTEHPSAETSVAVYLAANDIDVWGMDFAWTRVPVGTTDFSFMQDWGIERDADHTLAAMSVARLIRGLTHQGFGRLNLLGFSYGVGVVYAAAGRETQQPFLLRDIRGLIAVDQGLKLPVESARLTACDLAAELEADLAGGVYHNAAGITFGTFADLAATSPNDPSPILPPQLGLTNYEAFLFLGANTFVLDPGPAPFFHFVGGLFDAEGTPVGLRYSDPSRMLTLAASLPPYMPVRSRFDMRSSQCDQANVSFDDHLADISVPILYLGTAGGFGTLGNHTGSLTASDDVTNINVQLQSSDHAAIDYGHADLFIGSDAPDLVWQHLHSWIADHGRSPRRWKHGKRRR